MPSLRYGVGRSYLPLLSETALHGIVPATPLEASTAVLNPNPREPQKSRGKKNLLASLIPLRRRCVLGTRIVLDALSSPCACEFICSNATEFDCTHGQDAFGRDPRKETEFWMGAARSVLDSEEVKQAIEEHAADGGDGLTDEQRAYMEFLKSLDGDSKKDNE